MDALLIRWLRREERRARNLVGRSPTYDTRMWWYSRAEALAEVTLYLQRRKRVKKTT